MMECDNGYDFIINFCKTIIEGEVDLTKAEYRILIYLIVALDDKKFKQIQLLILFHRICQPYCTP